MIKCVVSISISWISTTAMFESCTDKNLIQYWGMNVTGVQLWLQIVLFLFYVNVLSLLCN